MLRWVAWQEEDRPGAKPGDNPTKVPYAPDGEKARADDPRTWGTRAAAEQRAALLPKPYGLGGIGIELGGADDGRWLAGVDLDTCRDPETGRIEQWALAVLEQLDPTYVEVSPSGTGIKVFCLLDPADVPALRGAMGTMHGKQFKRDGGEHPPAIELHISHRYFAVTGDYLAGTPGELRPVPLDALLWLVREAGPAFVREGRNGAPRSDEGAWQESGDLPARIARAATFNPTLARRWGGDWTGLNDASASGRAMALGAAMRRAGFTFEEMRQALHLHPDTREWADAKGEANGARELWRVWEAAGRDGAQKRADGKGAPRDDPWPVPNLALAAQAPLPPPTLPLADVFPPRCAEWIARAADAAGARPDYIAVAFLAGAGAAIGNARWGQPKEGWAEPPVINAALIGPPSAQKSPSLDQVVGPLLAVEQDANADWPERKRDWQTEKAAAAERRDLWQKDVKEAVKLGNPPPRMPPMLTTRSRRSGAGWSARTRPWRRPSACPRPTRAGCYSCAMSWPAGSRAWTDSAAAGVVPIGRSGCKPTAAGRGRRIGSRTATPR